LIENDNNLVHAARVKIILCQVTSCSLVNTN